MSKKVKIYTIKYHHENEVGEEVELTAENMYERVRAWLAYVVVGQKITIRCTETEPENLEVKVCDECREKDRTDINMTNIKYHPGV